MGVEILLRPITCFLLLGDPFPSNFTASPDFCSAQLTATEQADLDSGSYGLTCEESCITDYGPWCGAMGIRG